jgi:hypothetical protein
VKITITPEPTKEVASPLSLQNILRRWNLLSMTKSKQFSLVSPEKGQTSGLQMDGPEQALEHTEEFEPTPTKQRQPDQSSMFCEQTEALKSQHEITTQKPKPSEKDEHPPIKGPQLNQETFLRNVLQIIKRAQLNL